MTPSHLDTLGGPIEHARTLLTELRGQIETMIGLADGWADTEHHEAFIAVRSIVRASRDALAKVDQIIVLMAEATDRTRGASMAMAEDEAMADVSGWPVVVGADAATDDDFGFGSLPFRGVTPDPVRAGDGDDGRGA